MKLWNSAFDNVSVEDDPAAAISNYIRAKVMFSKTNPKASKIFATEIIQGGTNLTDFLQDDYKVWLRDKTSIIRKWSDNGQMDAVEPHHLMFMIWSSTQFYADFSIQVENGLEKEADDQEFEKIAETITNIILKGCGVKRINQKNHKKNFKREI